jgi:hypothetical protein
MKVREFNARGVNDVRSSSDVSSYQVSVFIMYRIGQQFLCIGRFSENCIKEVRENACFIAADSVA